MIENIHQAERCLFSIGHSNHPLEAFLGLLKMHSIEILIDARSYPYSKYAPHFASPSLSEAVAEVGAKYLFMGDELGGRPQEDEFYDDEGHVLYCRLSQSQNFLEGIRRLEEEMKGHCVAILCSEEDPSCCHRRLLVGRVLAERGIVLKHIRGNGRVQMDSEIVGKGLLDRDKGQTSLFHEPEELVWRSIQSVSLKGKRMSSSEH
ncbi:MAG: DUF488 domain-containing protein [Nitrospirales bacterium]|nr:DUF488 domain-containing protein [Nitrospirales bacterium]